MQSRRRQVSPAPYTFGVYGSTLVRFPVTQANRLCLLQGLREDRRHVRRFTQEIEDALQCLGRVVYKVFIFQQQAVVGMVAHQAPQTRVHIDPGVCERFKRGRILANIHMQLGHIHFHFVSELFDRAHDVQRMPYKTEKATRAKAQLLNLVQVKNVKGGLFRPTFLPVLTADILQKAKDELAQPRDHDLLSYTGKTQAGQHAHGDPAGKGLFAQKARRSAQHIGLRWTTDRRMCIKESAQERCATPWHAKNNDPLSRFRRHRMYSRRWASSAGACRRLACFFRELANVLYRWSSPNAFDYNFLRWRVTDEMHRAGSQPIGSTTMDAKQVSLVQGGQFDGMP